MLSPADMVIIGAAALIFFGPDQLPKVARRAGQVVRDVQNTSQSFIREMERVADASDENHAAESMSPPYDYRAYAEPTPAPAPEPPTSDETHAAKMSEPAPPGIVHHGESVAHGVAHEDASGI